MIKCAYPRYKILSFWVKTQIMQLCLDCLREYKDQQYGTELSEDQEDLGSNCENCGREHK